MISGIITLVPGAGIYFTAYYLVANQFAMAAVKGIGAIKVAFGIVLGIVCIVSIPREVFQKEYWVERKLAKQQKIKKTYLMNIRGGKQMKDMTEKLLLSALDLCYNVETDSVLMYVEIHRFHTF